MTKLIPIIILLSVIGLRARYGGGRELVTNGGFDTGDNWGEVGFVEISGGTANFTGVGNINQIGVSLVSGKKYRCIYTISGYADGQSRIAIGGTNGTNRSSNGEHIETITAGPTGAVQVVSTGTLKLDNVSVKRVGGKYRERR